MAFIRLYNSKTDFSSCLAIFRSTADASLETPAALNIASYLYCRPYLFLTPSTCFVLDDGTGKAVGYCIGVPDTKDFCEKWTMEYLPSLTSKEDIDALQACEGDAKAMRQREVLLHNPGGSCNGDVPGLWEEYSGHLHIDILGSHQGQEHGAQLLDALLGAMRARDCKAMHLGMVAGNGRALRFYERCGWRRFEGLEGESGEKVRTRGVIILVKKL